MRNVDGGEEESAIAMVDDSTVSKAMLEIKKMSDRMEQLQKQNLLLSEPNRERWFQENLAIGHVGRTDISGEIVPPRTGKKLKNIQPSRNEQCPQ